MSDEYEVLSAAKFERRMQLMVMCPNEECHWIEFIDPEERGRKHRCDRCKKLYRVPLKREEKKDGADSEGTGDEKPEATAKIGGQGGDS